MGVDKFPKVLVVSTNAWQDNTGINTLIQFFKCWEREKVAQIYTRTALPNTSVCDNFFRISENAVVKSWFKPNIATGSVVYNKYNSSDEEAAAVNTEKKLYSNSGKNLSEILNICRELAWKFGKWKTKELDEFIEEFNPDVLFIPIYPTIYMGRIQKYIIKKTGKPVVSYLADDNYTFRNIKKNPFAIIKRLNLRKYVKYIVDNSEKLLVIAPKQKEEYDAIFGINSGILTKGIDFKDKQYIKHKAKYPIKMVYTGKLIIGRWKSLAAIADVLEEINANSIKIELDIYTTESLTAKQDKALNKNGCSVKGALSLKEVADVQRKADILVFVEGLEKRHKDIARLSFSTKITDYLSNGKCIFAVGDKEIAPIDYFNRYDSAITASCYDEIKEKLHQIVNNTELIAEYSEKAYNCGKNNHSLEKMNQILIDSINDAIK